MKLFAGCKEFETLNKDEEESMSDWSFNSEKEEKEAEVS